MKSITDCTTVNTEPVELWLMLSDISLYKIETFDSLAAITPTIAGILEKALEDVVRIPWAWAETFDIETSEWCHDENIWMPTLAHKLYLKLRCGDVRADSLKELEWKLSHPVTAISDDELPF